MKPSLFWRLLLVLPLLGFVGCVTAQSRKSDTTNLFIEYKIQGGFAGGTHQLFRLSTVETNAPVSPRPYKREIYVVPEATARKALTLVQQHDFFSWPSARSSRYADVFELSLTVTTATTNKTVTVMDAPEFAPAKKKLNALLAELQALAHSEGRLVK